MDIPPHQHYGKLPGRPTQVSHHGDSLGDSADLTTVDQIEMEKGGWGPWLPMLLLLGPPEK